jgi:alkyldihydroxyacetonephosphate synthase
MLILGWEGESESRRREARRRLRALRALPGGAAVGNAWLKSRYAGPHLRDDLLDRGVLVETLETATTWSRLDELRAGVVRALEGLHVGCHISHVYPTGASLYFTALGVQSEEPVDQWQRHKAAACDAILAGGGTLTHHHAVGRDHAPWLEREDPGGVALLRALKDALDPAGIMNPGKLLA